MTDVVPNELGYPYDPNELYTRNDVNIKLGSAMTMIAGKRGGGTCVNTGLASG